MGEARAFHKYEGLGNDFILVEAKDPAEVSADEATRLCDRRFGVGADGVLLMLPPRAPCDVRMRVINADGSIPEMCGNGVRCVALHIARARGARHGTVRVETDAGERACVVDDDGSAGLVTVDMGPVQVLGDRAVDVQGRSIVLFGTFARTDVEHLGPRLATHPAFPRGTNVEFACVASDGIDLVVWERGVGITLACGTGACATVAVACKKDFAPTGKPVKVRLPGGVLEITIDEDSRATMTGPARRVYGGTIP
jgi:diaminopimelate epimerase